ncbi:MAG: MbcA/ParS/Xre antitoxin family protein [Vulcanimicrobiaceae bacterium]
MPTMQERLAGADEGEIARPLSVAGPDDRSAAAIRGFLRIAELWKLQPDQQVTLLGIPASTFYKYRKLPTSARLSRDTMERVSYIFGIFKALGILLPRTEAADAWIKRPSAAFGGRSALDRMLSGNVADLYLVRRYLDAERGA